MEQNHPDDLLKGSETVLFVDNKAMIIEVSEKPLEQLSCKVFTAESGKKAIEAYKQEKQRAGQHSAIGHGHAGYEWE